MIVLGTGGTIAGLATDAGDNVGYSAAQVGVDELLRGVASASGCLESEQVAQIDSKDMSGAIWRRLAERVAHHLARAEVAGIVVTHGTDTLEETAFFLHRLLAPTKPVVLTGAMRPASSLQADGPQNLSDAIAVAADPRARGVVVVFAGSVHGSEDVRKVHPYRLDAFSSGDSGPVARIEEGSLRCLRPWPQGSALGLDALARSGWAWPAVEILTSCAGAGGGVVRALLAAGVRGIVAAGTGNGSLHHDLEVALREAEAAGVAVLRSSRCLDGRIVGGRSADPLPSAGGMTPVQARIELMLRLMTAGAVRPASA
ncbi:MAG: asparaginase [Burkholderiaceae bacterium]